MPLQIVYIDDDPLLLDSMVLRLEMELDCKVTPAASVEEGIRTFDRLADAVDVVITDMHFGDASPEGGVRIVRHVRQSPDRYVPVIIMTGFGKVENAYKCMEAGAFTYVEKGMRGDESFQYLLIAVRSSIERKKVEDRALEQARELAVANQELKARTEQLEVANRTLDRMAHTDELTGLANRRYFYLRMEEEIIRQRRGSSTFSLIFFDVDNFKTINDVLGHDVGDQVLQEIGHNLRTQFRAGDIFARWGGDEFGIILPNTGEEGLRRVAADLKRRLSEVSVLGAEDVVLSVSIGGCVVPPALGCSRNEIFKRADQLMFDAKRADGGPCLEVLTSCEASASED